MKTGATQGLQPPDSNEAPRRRAILRVRGGALYNTRVVVRPGQTIRVGQDESANFWIPSDDQMAPAHFQLSWDGLRGEVKDLGSRRGTFLDGQRVRRGDVTEGSWIRAGQTDFMLFVEPPVRPPQGQGEPPSAERTRKLKVLEALSARAFQLYAVLDTARSERILGMLQRSTEEYHSLYEGVRGQVLERVAPCLVSFSGEGSGLLERLVEEGWGASWGFYLTCSLPLRELRRHLRKFLTVQVEGERANFLFRFYDPRVLRVCLPTFTASQKQELFGPIKAVFFESAGGDLIKISRPSVEQRT